MEEHNPNQGERDHLQVDYSLLESLFASSLHMQVVSYSCHTAPCSGSLLCGGWVWLGFGRRALEPGFCCCFFNLSPRGVCGFFILFPSKTPIKLPLLD